MVWMNDFNGLQPKRWENMPITVELGLRKWIESTHGKRLLIVEIGAGFNTPVVVRWPSERIVLQHPDANLIRIDLTDPSVPREIRNKSVTIKI